MSDELEILDFLDTDVRRSKKRQRLSLREQTMDMEDEEFVRRYRLNKSLFTHLCNELRPLFRVSNRVTDLSVETRVMTALCFYATGSDQRPIGDIGTHSMAQQTVSSVIAQVTARLNTDMIRKKYVHFPTTPEERSQTRAEFYRKFKIPGVLGCIDGTHVAIKRPTLFEDRYFCRKNYHSLNVQIICDANMYISSVDASFGGANHDSFIWGQHPIKDHLEQLEEATWLLGDSGYPLRRYLMTPIINAASNTPESYYTERHVHTRNIVDRTIGLLKARFRCLLVHRVMEYAPEVAASIVNACVILHNMCNRARLPLEPLTTAEASQEARLQAEISQRSTASTAGSNRNNVELERGLVARRNLILRLWDARAT